jgi:signal transduction histidine kinase/CHASE2 domain-containing sensor protein
MQSLFLNRRLGALLIGGLVTILLLFFWQGGFFRSAQLSLTNLYFVGEEPSGEIVLVAIDDASLAVYGRSPAEWSREIYADLMLNLSMANARVVAFDLLFSEAAEGDALFAEAMIAARQDNEHNNTRTVIATAGFGLPLEPLDAVTFPQSIRFENALRPIDSIGSAASYWGVVNAFVDVDTLIRRQTSLVYYGDQPYLSFSLATYLAWLRIPSTAFSQIIQVQNGVLALTPERSLHLDSNGLWMQHFFGAPSRSSSQTFTTVSLLDVLEGRVDPAIFNDKIVLVGLMTVAGDADRYPVPSEVSGDLMAGVEIQANAIESLISNRLPVELGNTSLALLITVLALASSWLYAYPHWYWKLLLALMFVIFSFIVAFVIFNSSYLIVPMFYPLLALVLPAIAHIGLDTSREISLRRQTDFLLHTLGELTQQRLQLDSILPRIAKDVQGFLPNAVGAIYLRQKADTPLQRAYHWPVNLDTANFESLMNEAEQSSKAKRQGQNLSLPIVWQGQIRGVLLISHEMVARREKILMDFVSRITPIIESTLLYEEISRQRSTLSTVLANTPSAVLVLDNNYRIVIYNERAAGLLKSHQQTLSARPVVDALAALGVQIETQKLLLGKMQQTVAFHHELSIAERSYNLEAALVLSLQQWVFVLTDVTELVELSKLKTRMIRMASHDLKNPLGRIVGYAQLLQARPDMDEKARRFLQNIENSSDEMTRLIADLLDLERMRSASLQKEAYELRQVVSQIFSRHEPDALQKQQQYAAEILAEEIPMTGDLRQLSQVISNLIGNAIKYTPNEGSIIVRLRRENRLACFEVEDTGVGIAKEAQANLFTEFYRVRTRATAGISGTGLGLSFVKTVIEAHGGQVGVDSEEGKGSKFYFTLPISNGENK